jgi:hypothetical protein
MLRSTGANRNKVLPQHFCVNHPIPNAIDIHAVLLEMERKDESINALVDV